MCVHNQHVLGFHVACSISSALTGFLPLVACLCVHPLFAYMPVFSDLFGTSCRSLLLELNGMEFTVM